MKTPGPRAIIAFILATPFIKVLIVDSTIKAVEAPTNYPLESAIQTTGFLEHANPSSILHSSEHPSKFSRLPSSHSSELIKTLSPHFLISIVSD